MRSHRNPEIAVKAIRMEQGLKSAEIPKAFPAGVTAGNLSAPPSGCFL